jgi:hypothetical protein
MDGISDTASQQLLVAPGACGPHLRSKGLKVGRAALHLLVFEHLEGSKPYPHRRHTQQLLPRESVPTAAAFVFTAVADYHLRSWLAVCAHQAAAAAADG